MKKHLIWLLAAFSILIVSCQKELSFEGSNSPAGGSLQSDATGDCLPKTVNGNYMAGSVLVPATNTISVQVNVTKTGSYVVYTDTVNGFFFRATGTFTTLGANNVTLRGFGTPFAATPTNFVVTFDTTFCDIQVDVISPGIGNLGGSPNACAPITVSGGYSPGVALTSSNFAVVQVDVTTAGLISIKTDTVAGIWFSFSGNLPLGTGQVVTLTAFGSIPAATTAGDKTFTVKLGSSICTFIVSVAGPAVYTINCPGVVVNGTYQVGIALNPAYHIITIPITVVTPGAYNIDVSINGMRFTGSGTLTAASGSITITGVNTSAPTGPPGIYNLSVGTPACLIPITVAAAPVINWKFTVVGGATYQGSTLNAALTPNNPIAPFTTFDYEGVNVATDSIVIQFIDLAGGINANETYDTKSQGATNVGFDFEFFDGAGTLVLVADPFDTSVGIIFTVQTHNTTTRTITGIFSGTANDAVSGTVKTVSNGTFNITY